MKQSFFMCIFLYLIVIKCHAKKLNLYTNYKEELTETFDYSLFQPYYKVCFMKIIELEKKLLDIFDVIVILLFLVLFLFYSIFHLP